MSICGICGSTERDLSLRATERMFGGGGEFWYDRCGACGCVQIREVPDDLSAYYGAGYYSLDEPEVPSVRRRAYRRLRDALLFGRARRAGFLVAAFMPTRLAQQREWFRRAGVSRKSYILDVGCGIGLLLRRLVDEGYEHAEGVDPFIGGDITYRGRTLVRKASLAGMTGSFDLIMFHHSLEHITEQRETLRGVATLLRAGGVCLVRVPIVGTWAFEHYRDRWVQLDAPRHVILHTEASVRCLAESAGLVLERVDHDSTAFTFLGSELYRRDVPLVELPRAGYTAGQRREFERRARRLNAARQGDQAAFYLRKPA